MIHRHLESIDLLLLLSPVTQFSIGGFLFLVFLYSGWRCEVCDLQENIWMNLTDGKVLCGRRYFDGSGGNNHALLHYQETGYPLAVKLGTITPDGAGKQKDKIRIYFHSRIKRIDFFFVFWVFPIIYKMFGIVLTMCFCLCITAFNCHFYFVFLDVYSYDEDDMVLDSKLPEHLAHFGINMMTMEKVSWMLHEKYYNFSLIVHFWEFEAIKLVFFKFPIVSEVLITLLYNLNI